MEFSKKFSVKLKDYFLFNLNLIKGVFFKFFIFLVIMTFILAGYLNDFSLASLKLYRDFLIYLTFGTLVVAAYLLFAVYRSSRKVFLPMKDYFLNMELIVTEEGIKQVNSEAEAFINYKDVYKFSIGKCYAKCLISNRQGIIIPLRYFSKEEIEKLYIIKDFINKAKE